MNRQRSNSPDQNQQPKSRQVMYVKKGTDLSATQTGKPTANQKPANIVSMYKHSADLSLIQVKSEEAQYFDSVDELSKYIASSKNIKDHSEEWYIDQSVIVRDISLKSSGPQEDEEFAKDTVLWKNIRRGNTIVELYDPSDYERLMKTLIARKGLNKFFDLAFNFVSKEGRYKEDQLDQYEVDVKNYILGPIKKAILEGFHVEVIKTLKANGENAQISWVDDVDAWLIASKNVALLARNVEDLKVKQYKSMRHNFTSLMAHYWFKHISNLNQKELEHLKADFNNRTFIGEYIGNPYCQHLVKYPRETFIFYAIVENESPSICIPNEQAVAIFKKHGLDTVFIKSLGDYTEYDALCDTIANEQQVVASKSIQEEEEGSVLYFIKRDKKNAENDEVLSLTKLKTLEYRLFRKMREKLRSYVNQTTNVPDDILIERYIKESKNLCRGYDLPRPIEFYIDICVTAFQLVSRGQRKEIKYFSDLLLDQQCTFMEEVINIHEERFAKKKSGRPISFESKVLNEQSLIVYNGYSGQRVKSKKKIEKQIVVEEEEDEQEIVEEKKEEIKSSYKPKFQNIPLKKCIVLAAPIFSIENEAIDALKGDFNFVEVAEFTRSLIEVSPEDDKNKNKELTLIFIPSLRGLYEFAESHKDNIFYFIYKFNEKFLDTALIKNSQKSKNPYYSPVENISKEKLATYIRNEKEILNKTNKKLATIENVEHKVESENELMKHLIRIKTILHPQDYLDDLKDLDESASNQSQSQSESEQIHIISKESQHLKSSIKHLENAVEQKPKKKVHINDVPQFETIVKNVYVAKKPQNESPSIGKSRKEIDDEEQSVIPIQGKLFLPKKEIDSPVSKPNTQKQPAQKKEVSQIESKKTSNTIQKTSGQKTIIVVIPLGIPGMGKTTFIQNYMKQYFNSSPNCSFVYISNDKIRRRLIDDWLIKNPGKHESESFDDTFPQTAQLFQVMLGDAIKLASKDQKQSNHVIVLDKNHPPSRLNESVDTIEKLFGEISNKQTRLVRMALIPEMENSYKDYPFSLNFLMQCYLRCLKREYHETLKNDDPNHMARVQFFFFKAYQKVKFDKAFLQKYKITDFFSVPLTYEHPDIELPINLQVVMQKCLEMTGSEVPKPNEVFERFVDLMDVYKHVFHLKSHREDEYNSIITDTLSSILSQESSPTEKPQNKHLNNGTTFNRPEENKKLDAKISPQNSKEKAVKQQDQVKSKQQEVNQRKKLIQEQFSFEKVSEESFEIITPPQKQNTKAAEQNAFFQDQQDKTPHFASTSVVEKTNEKTFSVNKSKDEEEKKKQSSDIGFEQVVKRKGKKGNKPVFLGISLEDDKFLQKKLKSILTDGFEPLVNFTNTSVIKDTQEALNQIWQNNKKDYNGWRKPDDYHVTTLYVNKEQEKMEKKLFTEFEEDVEVSVEILAIIVVPGKIVTGICFPDFKMENRCPHVTLMINEWKPVMSNSLLEQTCKFSRSQFASLYTELEMNGKVQPGDEFKQTTIKIDKNGPSLTAYFLQLTNSVVFDGITKTYY